MLHSCSVKACGETDSLIYGNLGVEVVVDKNSAF